MKRFSLVLVAALTASLYSSSASAATIYNPQTAFSGSNPSGAWTYGVLDTTNSNPATNLTPFTNYYYSANLCASRNGVSRLVESPRRRVFGVWFWCVICALEHCAAACRPVRSLPP
jgi:hypothetical protein